MPARRPYVETLFCDESGTHGAPHLYLGALRCSQRRGEILRSKLQELRGKYDLRAEMKWTKVSMKMLPAYEEWVDVFLNDQPSRLRVMRARRHGGTAMKKEGAFFDLYRYFLLCVVPPRAGIRVTVDRKDSRWTSRWDTVQYLVNAARQANWGIRGRNVILEPLDSHQDDLLQLTDVLLGAIACSTNTATSAAKRSLMKTVSGHVEQASEFGRRSKIQLIEYVQ